LRIFAQSQAKNIIRGAIDQEWIGQVANAVSQAKGELSDFIDDVETLEPGGGLITGLANLIFDRIENAMHTALPSGGISIPVSFDVDWHVDVPYFDFATLKWRTKRLSYSETISLGRVRLDLSDLCSTVRNAIKDMQWLDVFLSQLATEVQQLLALRHQLQLHQRDAEAARDQHAQLEAHIRNENVPLGEIRVVAPLAGVVVQSDGVLQIELEGVPESMLGFGRNQQRRVHVWLNDELLDLASFAVYAKDDKAGASAGAAILRFAPGAVVSDWGNNIVLPIAAASHPMTLPSFRAPPRAVAGIQSRAAQGIAGRPGSPSAPRGDANMINLFNPPPKLTLRRALTLGELRDGVNTVIAVMVDGRQGRRVAKQAFFASSPLVTKKDENEPKLPNLAARFSGAPVAARSKALRSPSKDRARSIRRAMDSMKKDLASALTRVPL
jgi:hypothetical protein